MRHVCKEDGKPLTGRQRKWCSRRCYSKARRRLKLERAVLVDHQTYAKVVGLSLDERKPIAAVIRRLVDRAARKRAR